MSVAKHPNVVIIEFHDGTKYNCFGAFYKKNYPPLYILGCNGKPEPFADLEAIPMRCFNISSRKENRGRPVTGGQGILSTRPKHSIKGLESRSEASDWMRDRFGGYNCNGIQTGLGGLEMVLRNQQRS
jgi:hypothetical protein